MAALSLAVAGIALADCVKPALIVTALYLAVGPRLFRRTLALPVGAFVVATGGRHGDLWRRGALGHRASPSRNEEAPPLVELGEEAAVPPIA